MRGKEGKKSGGEKITISASAKAKEPTTYNYSVLRTATQQRKKTQKDAFSTLGQSGIPFSLFPSLISQVTTE